MTSLTFIALAACIAFAVFAADHGYIGIAVAMVLLIALISRNRRGAQ